MSGHSQPGTIGKKLSRRVKRQHERAIKARGKREKEMQQVAFTRGFNLGADLMKSRILNATAGMYYTEEPNDQIPEGCSVPVPNGDPMSESTLGVQEADIFHDEAGDGVDKFGGSDFDSAPFPIRA